MRIELTIDTYIQYNMLCLYIIIYNISIVLTLNCHFLVVVVPVSMFRVMVLQEAAIKGKIVNLKQHGKENRGMDISKFIILPSPLSKLSPSKHYPIEK